VRHKKEYRSPPPFLTLCPPDCEAFLFFCLSAFSDLRSRVLHLFPFLAGLSLGHFEGFFLSSSASEIVSPGCLSQRPPLPLRLTILRISLPLRIELFSGICARTACFSMAGTFPASLPSIAGSPDATLYGARFSLPLKERGLLNSAVFFGRLSLGPQ